MKTVVTVNKQKFTLETVVADAVAKAADGYVAPPDLRDAGGDANKAHWITVARYISRALGATIRYTDLDPNDLVESVHAKLQRRAPGAGARALSAKYGKSAAERIVQEKAGRHINLQH